MTEVEGNAILWEVPLKEGENTDGWGSQGKLHRIIGICKDKEKLIGKSTFGQKKAVTRIKVSKWK